MAIKKITFTNANVTAQNDADLYYFLQGGTGILKGIKNEVKASNNANRFIFESGYVSIYGRLLFVDNNTDITVPLNRTAKGYIVLDINTATNSAELTYAEATNGGYPLLIQENLSAGAGHYQFALAAYSKTGAALTPDQSFKPTFLYPHMERQQGTSNAGKVLAVGTDGYIILMNQSGINAGQLEGHGASYFQEKQAGKGLSTNDYDATEKAAVAANTAARHSHSNKTVLDGITQEIVNKANSLKYDAEGKISPDLIPSAGINVKSADTAYMDEAGRNIKGTFDKGLYNLGAFDTVTDNDDGTATITRKTGYANLEGLNWRYAYNRWYAIIPDIAKKAFAPFSNNYKGTTSDPENIPNSVQCSQIDLDGNYGVYVNNGSSTKKPTGTLQYELATGYTEKVIKNQPLTDLPADGTKWLREEWEKSYNLFNPKYLTYHNDETKMDQYMINLEPGTYALTFDQGTANTHIRIQESKNGVQGDILQDLYPGQGIASTTFNLTSASSGVYIIVYDYETQKNFSLNKGDKALPYQPYNAKSHITNEQARYLIKHEEDARNLWNKEASIKGYYRDYTTGNMYQASTEAYEEVACEPNAYYSFSKVDDQGGYTNLCFLTKDKQFISGMLKKHETPVLTPPNCYYIAMNVNQAVEDTFILNKGDKPLPYTPYNSKEHITNEQASFLESEEKRSRNLCNVGSYSFTNTGTNGNPVQIASKLSDILPDAKAGDYLYLTFEEINVYTAEFYLAGSGFNWYNGYAKTITDEDLNGAVYVYGVSNEQCTYKNITVAKNRPLAYEPYAGQIIHETDLLKALQIYGNKPALGSVVFDATAWFNYARDNATAAVIKSSIQNDLSYVNTDGNYNDSSIRLLPTGSYKSIADIKIERISGDIYIKWALTSGPKENGSSYGAVTFAPYFPNQTLPDGTQASTFYFKSYSNYSEPHTGTFRLSALDVYGNEKHIDFTITLYTIPGKAPVA